MDDVPMVRPFELGPCIVSDGQRGWSVPHHVWSYISATREEGSLIRVLLLCQRCATIVYRIVDNP